MMFVNASSGYRLIQTGLDQFLQTNYPVTMKLVSGLRQHMFVGTEVMIRKKGKAIPVTGRGGP
jgi:hypothetical protein